MGSGGPILLHGAERLVVRGEGSEGIRMLAIVYLVGNVVVSAASLLVQQLYAV